MYNYIKVRDVRASQLPADGLPERMSKVISSHKHLLAKNCYSGSSIPDSLFSSLHVYLADFIEIACFMQRGKEEFFFFLCLVTLHSLDSEICPYSNNLRQTFMVLLF